MIDTVSITIPEERFHIINHEQFTPCTENLYKPPYIKVTGKSPFKAINNATEQMKMKYGYLPRITLFKALRRGGFQIFLKIEFSVPKLLYDNNFDEVSDRDFDNVCMKLKSLLFNMGVIIREVRYIKESLVSTLHYSKNIVLSDYSTPHLYLKEFQRADISKLYDTNQTNFRNDGHAVKFHSNDYEVILYDKLKDLNKARKSDKRAIEKDNFCQLNLFSFIKPVQPFEILRIEIRLGSRRKIKQIFDKEELEYTDLTFEEIFKKEYSRQILMNTLIQIDNSIPPILNSDSESLEKFVIKVRLNNPELNYSQLLKVVGAKALYMELGLRGFRDITEKNNGTAWYRLKKQLRELNFDDRDTELGKIIEEVKRFDTICLDEYKDKM